MRIALIDVSVIGPHQRWQPCRLIIARATDAFGSWWPPGRLWLQELRANASLKIAYFPQISVLDQEAGFQVGMSPARTSEDFLIELPLTAKSIGIQLVQKARVCCLRPVIETIGAWYLADERIEPGRWYSSRSTPSNSL
jgi:hypothetical protein